jgi:HPt (histidine-containing phosphotransfer) domain-containing protein
LGWALKAVAIQFVAEVPQRIVPLGDAIRRRDSKTTAEQAHTIKGAATAIRSDVLVESASKIETCGRRGDIDAAQDLLTLLREQLARVKATLEQPALLTG